jgi:hypothetical protein
MSNIRSFFVPTSAHSVRSPSSAISRFESYAASFRGEARRAESPESSNRWQRLLDSGLAATRRPGMTSFMESIA